MLVPLPARDPCRRSCPVRRHARSGSIVAGPRTNLRSRCSSLLRNPGATIAAGIDGSSPMFHVERTPRRGTELFVMPKSPCDSSLRGDLRIHPAVPPRLRSRRPWTATSEWSMGAMASCTDVAHSLAQSCPLSRGISRRGQGLVRTRSRTVKRRSRRQRDLWSGRWDAFGADRSRLCAMRCAVEGTTGAQCFT